MENMVLVVLDTVSAFHTSLHSDRDTTPFLEQLAEENTFCRYGYSNGAWTVSAHASLFSGKTQDEHGTGTAKLQFDEHSFVEDLQEQGYNTIGITNNLNLTPETGFDAGFDQFYYGSESIALEALDVDLPALEQYAQKNRDGEYDSAMEKITDFFSTVIRERDLRSASLFLRHLPARVLKGNEISISDDNNAPATNVLAQETADEPFFMFLNYMEAHKALSPPEGYVEGVDYQKALSDYEEYRQHTPEGGYPDMPDRFEDEMAALYDGAIRYLDEKVEALVRGIQGEHPDTVFIIVSDHGENINDYGVYDHQYSTYEKLLRVPFIIAGPEIPDQTIEKPVSLADLPGLIENGFDFDALDGRVVASYQGVYNLAEDADPDGEFAPLFYNESRTRVTAEEGRTDNSHLDDHLFQPRPSGFDAGPETDEDIQLRHDELAGIDF